MKSIPAILILVFLLNNFLKAKENINHVTRYSTQQLQVGCSPSVSTADLDIGNVRAKILMNGDMWWDLIATAKYEIPKNSGKNSLYAGALWIGGVDVGGNLKVAAQTYRQSGSDFWPGPLDTSSGSATVSAATCLQYDRHWKVTRTEVKAFRDSFLIGSTFTPSVNIQNWPGNGTGNQAHQLAPFFDMNGDGEYHSTDGDYPGYDLSSTGSCSTCSKLNGDQTIWWVFNDCGNVHGETGGQQIGLEIHAQAFAYNSGITNLDNSTFYEYKIINRSTLTVNQTYFGQWVDPDLGNYLDDFVGCDVTRGMGYCYNGDPDDDGADGYGLNPPAIGVDFLKGPKADVGDGIDNDRDSCIDCTWMDSSGHTIAVPDYVIPELIKMSKFVYYNNSSDPVSGNPNLSVDYYQYMRGIWRNGTKITYGGNGHGGGAGSTNDTCDFMFPGDSDPAAWGTIGVPHMQWDEVTAGNVPGDRRFLESAGPFTLTPGGVQCILTSVIWGRASSGGPLASVATLKHADDEVQQFFNSCFTSYPVSIIKVDIASEEINVYPNPFQNFTTLKFQLKNKNQFVDVILYDGSGKIVRQYKSSSAHDIIIKKDELNSGIYFYTVSDKGSTIKTGKLVIVD